MAEDKDDKDRDGAAPSEALYRWWLGALPDILGGLAPPASKEPAQSSSGDRPSAPFPVDQLTQALALAQAWLESLYESYLRTLITSRPGEESRTVEEFVGARVAGMADRLVGIGKAVSGQPNLAELNARLTGAPLAAFGEALRPLSLNLERAYGGLADAIGLAPLREFEAAGRDTARASAAHRQAQVEYLEVVAGALHQGAAALTLRLGEMAQRGEAVDSLLALVRLWARTTDAAMHDAMQSPRALEASAKLLHAAAQSRLQQQRVVAIVSEALNVPTRAEVDEAYREIQELKRELRRMRKGLVVAPLPMAPASPTRARAAKTAPTRKTGRKGASTA